MVNMMKILLVMVWKL